MLDQGRAHALPFFVRKSHPPRGSRMYWRSVFSLILLTICPITLWPQGTRSARPVDIHGTALLFNGQPAPAGTAVTLATPGGGFNGQSQTNGQGKVELLQLAPAVYEVHVRAFGYLPE